MVRYGIAGFGHYAVKRLIPGFAKARNSKLVALSRRTMDRAQSSAAEYSVPYAYASTAELCACPEVDAIFVASPNAVHLSDVLTCIKSRKPVLCEKPFAMNTAEAQEMADTAQREGVLLGVAQIFRFDESVNRLRSLIATGAIGRPVFARSEFSFLAAGNARTWLADAALAGGGAIADVGVHCIDTLRYILQDEVTHVTAVGLNDETFVDVEKTAAIILEFARGTLGSVFVSFESGYRSPIEIVGTDASLYVDDGLTVDRPVRVEVRKPNGEVIHREVVDNAIAYAIQLDAFSAAVESGVPFPVPASEGVRNQQVLDAAFRAIRTGRREAVGD